MILPAPMLLSERVHASFPTEGWLWELKFDGYRLVAGVRDGVAQMATRNGANATKWFPEIAAGLATLPGGPHVLDGEVVVLDDLGRSQFDRLHQRARRRRWYEGADPVVFCAFDLLTRDGKSLIGQPVEWRKAQLQELLTPAAPSILYVSHLEGDQGQALFEQAKALKLEGLVRKRRGSLYLPGERSEDWVKVKPKGSIPPQRFRQAKE